MIKDDTTINITDHIMITDENGNVLVNQNGKQLKKRVTLKEEKNGK